MGSNIKDKGCTDTVFNLWIGDPLLAEFTDANLRLGAAVLKVDITDF